MMLWSRLRQSRFKFNALSNEFRRFYSLNSAPFLANQHIFSRKSVPILNCPKFIVQEEQLVLFRKVRLYAKSVKVIPKKAERDESEPRMNEEITVPTVRLVIDEENHCIVPRHEALARAKSLKLDLVEVDRNGKPPVCKIFDYNKQKYIQQTKEKERTKSKSTLRPGGAKEIRFGGKIKQNDLKIKADMVKRLMEKGYRVKCTATDTAEGVDLKALLSKFTALIDDVAVDESGPKYEKKQAFVIVRHVKFGPPTKSGKKASAAAATDSPQSTEDSDEGAPTNKSDWVAFDEDNGGAHPIFEIDDVETGQLEISKQEIPFSVDKNPGRAAEPTRIPVGMNGPGATNTTNTTPMYPNNGNQTRIRMNTRPDLRPGQQVEAPACGIPKQDSPVSRQVEAPARGVPKQDSPVSRQVEAPAKSYGIFSAPKVNTAAAAGNRNPGDKASGQNSPAKTYGIFSAPKVNTTAAGGSNRNPGTAAASSPAAADSRTGQARYGIFSAEEKEKQAQKR